MPSINNSHGREDEFHNHETMSCEFFFLMTSTCGEHGMRVDKRLNHICNCFCRIRDVVDTSIGGTCMDRDAGNAKQGTLLSGHTQPTTLKDSCPSSQKQFGPPLPEIDWHVLVIEELKNLLIDE